MKAILFTTTLFLFLYSTISLADVTSVEASIDKNPVMLDEAIRLTVVANGSADRNAFDSTSLLKDFVVGRTSVSSQTSMVNFTTSKTTTWTTTLFPRKEGTFTIPAFSIEGKQTAPIRIQVIPVQQSKNVSRDYYVTTDVDITKAYVNQQLFYTVKLHLATSIERGSLQSPEMPNAEIKQLGEDKQKTEIINGRRYQVIERNFTIVPQASGEFTIKGPIFSAEVAAANSNQRFGFFNSTQQVNRVGPDITVNIEPIPAGINYPWLPSEMVRVDEEWPQGDSFMVGEPITRIVTLTALGVVEEQLPAIPEFYPPHFKLYPDQSMTTSVEKDQTVISQRKTSLAVIPTKAGDFVLPEVTIPWFNTLTEQTEYATLPARTVTVSGAANSPQSTGSYANDKKGSTSLIEDDASVTNPQTGNQDQNVATDSPLTNGSFSLLTWIFAGLWLITAVAWIVSVIYKRKQGSHVRSATSMVVKEVQGAHELNAYKQLMKDVKHTQVASIGPALQTWLHCLYPDSSGFISPVDHTETRPIQEHLNTLQQSRFSHEKATWDPKAMQAAIKQARDAWLQSATSDAHTLSNLYPRT